MTFPARYAYSCAIQGVDTILTNIADTSAVATAWTGTDHTSVTSGLFVDLDASQSAHPWEPFQSGGTLTLSIADDTIGVLMHRSDGGAESELVTSLDVNDTTVTVKDTSAFASSGVIHIGTEAVSYESTNATQFLTCTRGVYSPFGCDASGSGDETRFGHNHRVEVTDYSPPLAPKVTQYPRSMIGRWVGLWVHGYESDGTLQTKANATLLFAGRIAEVRDDADTLCTVIVCDDILTDLKNATIGRDFFSGEVADGMWIPAGKQFAMKDYNGSNWETATPLAVVASGASGAYEMNEGFYSHSQLFTALSAWWVQARQDNDLHGSYSIAIAPTQSTPESQRTKIYWYIPGTAAQFKFTLPKAVAIWLGLDGSPWSESSGNIQVGDSDDPSEHHHFYRDHIPLRSWIAGGISNIHLRLENLSGAFQDQLATMPAVMQPPPYLQDGRDWALFKLDGKILVRAAVIDNADGTFDLEDLEPSDDWFGGTANTREDLAAYSRPIDDGTPVRIQQVFAFEMQCGEFTNRLMMSTSVAGYNHGTLDDLPYGIGLGYPAGLFGTAWETSIQNMPGAEKMIAPMIDKPTKISALLGSDLLLRHAFPVWKSGGLRMATWQTPSAALSVATLTEANKAEPSGNDVNHRCTTMLSDRWSKGLIKIRYNRSMADGDDTYQGTINVEDRTAIDDAGDRASPFTIDAKHTYSQFLATGAGIEDLVPTVFIPIVTMFTKPVRTLRRSIAHTLWLDLAPGDVVTVSDEFARDPTSGLRIISNRPAIVIRHRYSPPSVKPGSDGGAMVAEVELMFSPRDRFYAYSPSALIDATADADGFSSGYNSSVPSLRCLAHTYSESSEAVDASHFAAGDLIRIIEVDPADPASPTTWLREVDSVSGSDITLTSTLSSPAWDANLEYRVIPDAYDAVQTSQQDKAFQADDSDGLIDDAAQANLFGVQTSTVAATASAVTDRPELHAELTFGDAKPFDVGSIVGCARVIENLIDRKTAISSPMLSQSVFSNSTYSTGQGYKLVAITPIYLSTALLSNSVQRYIEVAPWLRSSDGTETTVRVSLCTHYINSPTVDDIDRGVGVDDATWTTSSTTWATGTPTTLSCNMKNASGIAWLLIECNFKAETRGLAKAAELARQVF